MNCWPVIVRELRTEARRPFNFWLRVLGAGAITMVFGLSMLNQSESPANLGARLFGNLNATLFTAFWVLVPFLTADCISQEKRDGTLGLLFLTRLTAGGIVVGKSLIHGLRSATLLLCLIPVMAVPFLLGGVSWKDALLSLLLNSSAVVLALTAGLLASTFAKDWTRALLLAALIGFSVGAAFMLIHFLGFSYIEWCFGSRNRFGFPTFRQTIDFFWRQDLFSQLKYLYIVSTNLPGEGRYYRMFFNPSAGFWSQTWATQPAVLHRVWLQWATTLLCLSLLTLVGAVHLAAAYIRRFWREEPPSRQQLWLLQTFCTPKFWRSFFKGRMLRTLNRNPIGWLQQYSWSDRLTKWGWCLFAVTIECLLVTDPSLAWLWTGQSGVAQAFLLGLAFTASGSFREEKQTGALELLLVTPLNERQLIGGRVRGIWSQFLPAVLVLGMAWVYLAKDAKAFIGYDPGEVWRTLVFPIFFVTSYLTLPLVGLYFSMRRLNFVAAWLLTCLSSLVLPLLIYGVVVNVVGLRQAIYSLLSAQVAGALIAWLLLNRDLRRRSFSILRGTVAT
jgi:ABC-type transport system involved in cytochrome c biogenesis permease component